MLFFEKKSQKFQKPIGVKNQTDFQRIAIVPTYRTNLHKKSQLKPWTPSVFPSDLKLENFCWIVDRLKNTENLQSLLITGSGEPTVWRVLDQAIYYAHQHKVKIVLFTNALAVPKKSLPDRVIISLHAYLDHLELRSPIEETIRFYLEKKIPVHLKYMKRANDDEVTLALAKNLATQFKLPLDLSRGYTDPELSCATCAICQLTVQPDGDTVTLCNFLPFTAKLSEHLSLSDLYEKEFLPKLNGLGLCRANVKIALR